MDVTIGPAAPSDFEQVGRVFAEENRFHAELLPELFRVTDPIITPEWFEAVLSSPRQALLVAKVAGQVVGLLLLQKMANPDDEFSQPRRYLYVDELVVAQAYRRLGIGQRLLEAAEQWALDRGISELELNVWERNLGAIAFYEQLGYTTVRRRMKRNLSVRKFSQPSERLSNPGGDPE